MTERPFSPDEFARLLALPEDHPDRVRFEASGSLEAWRRMLHEFESPSEPQPDRGELTAADAALERHITNAFGLPAVASARPAEQKRAAATPFSGWIAALSRPAVRTAFAFGAAAIVAGSLWWATSHQTPGAIRGGAAPGVAGLRVQARAGGALELSWTPVPGAERYQVRFIGADLTEFARLDDVHEATLTLAPGSLPAGLASGQELIVEVVALRGNDVIAPPVSRSVRLP